MQVTIDRRATDRRLLKYDDRPGHVTDAGRRVGIAEHNPTPGNKRFQELVYSMKPGTPAYIVDRDGAQRAANGLPFFVEEMPLGRARDEHRWIIGVGDEATGSSQVGLLKKHADEGSETPRRRWPHNAMQTVD